MIDWEFCKKFRFVPTNEWFMHNPASVLENNTHNLLLDFDIQTDHLISARQSDLIVINKKKKKEENLQNSKLCCPGWAPSKTNTKWKKKHKYPDLARELKKLERERDGYTSCNCSCWYSHQRINKGTGGLGNKRTNGDHPNYCITEINQNTEKSPRDLRRLAVTQTPVKAHQLTLI